MPRVIASRGPVENLLNEVSNSRSRVHPSEGSLTVRAGSLSLLIEPVLRFLDRSPDGCWTILAPRALRNGPDLVLESVGREDDRLALQYHGDYEAILRVDPGPDGGPVRLEAMAHLPHPVFSHLNAYCDMLVSGSRRLALSFSPCPEALIEVRPADYPTGRPLRLAYLDAHGVFHVVEATSGEKGPFHELGRGNLRRGQPLAITLHDRGILQARIVLEDWSAQVGTGLSPTAGYGLPVNAIEFCLQGDEPGAPAALFITLAGTSVGRGWDSVGHRAGTYRNRMSIDVLAPGGYHESTGRRQLPAPVRVARQKARVSRAVNARIAHAAPPASYKPEAQASASACLEFTRLRFELIRSLRELSFNRSNLHRLLPLGPEVALGWSDQVMVRRWIRETNRCPDPSTQEEAR
jgi:hypothetical protein